MNIDKKIEPATVPIFEFDMEWSDPDAPENVKYEPVSFCDLFLYRPVENENDNKEENNNLSSTPTLSSAPQVVVPPRDNNYFLNENGELSWDLSTIEYIEKLKCPWKK